MIPPVSFGMLFIGSKNNKTEAKRQRAIFNDYFHPEDEKVKRTIDEFNKKTKNDDFILTLEPYSAKKPLRKKEEKLKLSIINTAPNSAKTMETTLDNIDCPIEKRQHLLLTFLKTVLRSKDYGSFCVSELLSKYNGKNPSQKVVINNDKQDCASIMTDLIKGRSNVADELKNMFDEVSKSLQAKDNPAVFNFYNAHIYDKGVIYDAIRLEVMHNNLDDGSMSVIIPIPVYDKDFNREKTCKKLNGFKEAIVTQLIHQ